MRTPLIGTTLALCLIGSGVSLRAANQPELSQERSVLKQFHDEIVAFENLEHKLRAKARVTREELLALQTQGDALKQRAQRAHRSMQTMIDKLKSAQLWTAEFDARTVKGLRANAANVEALKEIEGAGGVRAFLGQSTRTIRGTSTAIDAIVAELQPQSALHDMFNAVVGTPVHALILSEGRYQVKRAVATTLLLVACLLDSACGH